MKNVTKLAALLIGIPLIASRGGAPQQLVQQVDRATYLITAPAGTGDFASLNMVNAPVRQCVGEMVTKALEIVRNKGNSDFQLTIDGTVAPFRIMLTLFPAATSATSTACIFCQRAFQGAVIAEDTQTIAFEKSNPPRRPINFLIIPKLHVVNYKDPQWTADLFINQLAMAHKMAHKLKDPHSVRLQINNGSNAAQSVFHSHMHFTSNSSWK